MDTPSAWNPFDRARTSTIAIALAAALLITGGIGLAVAGDETPDAASPTASTSPAEGSEAELPEAFAVDWIGNLANSACVPSGEHSCRGVTVSDADDVRETHIDADVAEVDLTMTWNAHTPVTEELELSLVSGEEKRCGDGTCSSFYHLETVTGTSPLTIQADDLDIRDGHTLWIVVDSPQELPDPLYSDLEHEQSFQVEGTIQPLAAVDSLEAA